MDEGGGLQEGVGPNGREGLADVGVHVLVGGVKVGEGAVLREQGCFMWRRLLLLKRVDGEHPVPVGRVTKAALHHCFVFI